MILGPNDPRAVTGAERDAARSNTERWNELLGIAPMTKAQQERYEADLDAVLNLIGYEEDDPYEQLDCEVCGESYTRCEGNETTCSKHGGEA